MPVIVLHGVWNAYLDMIMHALTKTVNATLK